MKGEATEAQQFRPGCGSQQRTPSPRQSNESWPLCGKTLSALHLSINKLWFKGPHSFPEMKVLSAENFVVRLFVVQPRTVVVQDDFEALFKRIFRRKITDAKMEKICWQITVAAFMQPLQYDLRSPAAKDNSITNTATARSNLDAAITMRSAETELQNAIEVRATALEIVAPQPDLSKTHFVPDFLQNSIGNSSTSTTCNPIYSEGTILELQITMEFHRQLIHQHHLQSHLHCGNDPTVANHNGILSTANARNTGETPFTMRNRSEHDPRMIRPHTRPSRTRRTAEVDHRGSGTDFVWKNIGFRASAISQKRISCETSFKTPPKSSG